MTSNGRLCYHNLTEVLLSTVLKMKAAISVNDFVKIASPLFFRFSFYGTDIIYCSSFMMCIPCLKNKGECNLNVVH